MERPLEKIVEENIIQILNNGLIKSETANIIHAPILINHLNYLESSLQPKIDSHSCDFVPNKSVLNEVEDNKIIGSIDEILEVNLIDQKGVIETNQENSISEESKLSIQYTNSIGHNSNGNISYSSSRLKGKLNNIYYFHYF